MLVATLALGRLKNGCLHVICTFGASREKKQFYADLQQALSAIPQREFYIVLGDFNARVRSREGDGEWWYVRGPHGHGSLTEADKELLSFLSTNEATVYNTLF